MTRLTLRSRVAIAAAVAIVLALGLLAVAVLARLDDQLGGSLDRNLRTRAVEAARLAASTPRLLGTPGALEGRVGGSLFVQVVDRRGRIVARSGALGGRILPSEGALDIAQHRRRASYSDGRLGTDPVRLYASPLGELGQGPAAGGAVVVAGTTADIEDTIDDTRRFVLLVGLLAAAIGALLATLLTRRALRPLARLSSGARAIEQTSDHARRLPPPASQDEVGELAATLNAMLASLERASEAERRFVGDASHELRTPLTALRGNIAYARRHGAEAEVLADIDHDVTRMSQLLDDLLALAREDAGAPAGEEELDLAELARAAAVEDPRIEVDASPVLVRGERAALERALANLVENARKHGPGQGAIRIAARHDGERALLSVSDAGQGLAPGPAARAFERFWRGSSAETPGSGLGLAIVRAIAERHGGRVSVEGSRFTLDLPALSDLSHNVGRTGTPLPDPGAEP